MNKLGELTERQVRPPDILTEWARVTVAWWMHKIKGFNKNDFIMAVKTDVLLSC
ncbi:MAG TPA: 4a-hydroxytetrahydrobiopterin dehydratase [Nitrososphaera sp.]|nr:4a-hydroxytetrahydrobiopterin dehydratase [Nitrososphaera sp.]